MIVLAIEIFANIAVSRGIASANEFNTLAAPLLLIVGLTLAFFGRKFVKTLVFLAGGLAGAAAGFAIDSLILGGALALVGAIVGFVVVGVIAYVVARVALGVALAAACFFLVRAIIPNTAIALFVALIGLILGIIAFNKFLSFATAVTGGLIVAHALQVYTFNLLALAVGILIMVVGGLVQSRQLKKK
ncbi:MAG: hypothetical protein FJ358_06770 [Thaumarchaeota archaeon]|nr:hypothetical protein [Nitrososphaerota archaeon]